MDPLQADDEPDWLAQYTKTAEKPAVAVEEGFFASDDRKPKEKTKGVPSWRQKPKGLFDSDSDDEDMIPESVKEAKRRDEETRNRLQQTADDEKRRKAAKAEAEAKAKDKPKTAPPARPVRKLDPAVVEPKPKPQPAPVAPKTAKPQPQPKSKPEPEPEPEPEVDLFGAEGGPSHSRVVDVDTAVFAESQARRPQTKKRDMFGYGGRAGTGADDDDADDLDAFQREHALDDVFIPKTTGTAVGVFAGSQSAVRAVMKNGEEGGYNSTANHIAGEEGVSVSDLSAFERELAAGPSERERQLDAELSARLKLGAPAAAAPAISARTAAPVADMDVTLLSSYIAREKAAAAQASSSSKGLFDDSDED